MTSYAFWNNKGGVGKSFLCFISAAEYAHRQIGTDVYVIDLCPQANVSETILGGQPNSPDAINGLFGSTPRRTVAGYLEARLNSPFKPLDDVSPYVAAPSEVNSQIPPNLHLVCGDHLLEVISEAIRQTSQLSIPTNAWSQVICWIKDLALSLEARSGDRDAVFFIDCNPSFAVYTQLALVAAQYVVVPFTADDSSRRAIENVVALLYGHGDPHTESYAKISFSKKAKEESVQVPKLHTFISNRQTLYRGKPSSAFQAVNDSIKNTMALLYKNHRSVFAFPKQPPAERFVEVPDYHSACVVAATRGMPMHTLRPGPKKIGSETIQINKSPLDKYKEALSAIVDYM